MYIDILHKCGKRCDNSIDNSLGVVWTSWVSEKQKLVWPPSRISSGKLKCKNLVGFQHTHRQS